MKAINKTWKNYFNNISPNAARRRHLAQITLYIACPHRRIYRIHLALPLFFPSSDSGLVTSRIIHLEIHLWRPEFDKHKRKTAKEFPSATIARRNIAAEHYSRLYVLFRFIGLPVELCVWKWECTDAWPALESKSTGANAKVKRASVLAQRNTKSVHYRDSAPWGCVLFRFI